MKLLVIALALAFSLPSLAKEGAMCIQVTNQTQERDPHLVRTSQSVYLPPKAELFQNENASFYARFSLHQTTQSPEVIQILNEYRQSGDKSTAARKLRIVLNSSGSQEILESQRVDKSNLESALETKTVQWIGVEESPLEFNYREGGYLNNVHRTYTTLNQLIALLTSEQEAKDLMHLIATPSIALYDKRPELFEGTKFVPVDLDGRQQINSIAEYRITVLSNLQEKAKAGLLSIEGFNTIVNYSENNYIIYRMPEENEFEFLKSLSDDPSVHQLIKTLLLAHSRWAAINEMRDEAMATAISEQDGLGFVILGASHRPGVLSRLNFSETPRLVDFE